MGQRVGLSVSVSVCLSFCLSASLSACLSVLPSVRPSVCLSHSTISFFVSRDVKLPASKLSGPVNGDECYFWRTTGCYFADKCRFRHVPESKGVDLKRVEAKYGGKLRVTPPSSD